jgi:hypothetical protein
MRHTQGLGNWRGILTTLGRNRRNNPTPALASHPRE